MGPVSAIAARVSPSARREVVGHERVDRLAVVAATARIGAGATSASGVLAGQRGTSVVALLVPQRRACLPRLPGSGTIVLTFGAAGVAAHAHGSGRGAEG